MQDGVACDTATARLTMAWAAEHPHAALNWAAGLPAGPARDKSLDDAAFPWARKDVTAAAAWAKAAPEGSLPLKAYTNIMSSLGRDIPAAYVWINELPKGAAGHAVNNMFTFVREPEVNAIFALPVGAFKVRLVEVVSTKFFQSRPDQALDGRSPFQMPGNVNK